MKLISLTLLLSLASFHPLHAKSKPFDGFSAYLLGQPAADKCFANLIPQGESAISSMAETPEGGVLCGTRVMGGKDAWLFYFNAKDSVIRPEGCHRLSGPLAGPNCVIGLVRGGDKSVYGVATGLDNVDYLYEADVKAMTTGSARVFKAVLKGDRPEAQDLGVLFKGEGVSAVVADKAGTRMYGVTVPSQIFFEYDFKAAKVREIGRLPALTVEFKRYIGKSTRALVADDSGNVYGSANGGQLFKYTRAADKVDTLSLILPASTDPGYDAVSAWCRGASGRIFGGTLMDGKLFEFLPKSGKIRDLGFTGRTGNISGLCEKNGLLYGLSGSFKSSNSRLFSYDMNAGEYRFFPGFKVYLANTDRKYQWVPGRLSNLLLLKSGLLVTGENDMNGRFFTFQPALAGK